MIPVRSARNHKADERSDALSRELRDLRRSEAALRDFIETAAISLHWIGEDGTILWANQAELDLLGYARNEYIGHNIAEFHADAPVIADILARLGRGETLTEYPARLRRCDGTIRQVLISSSVLFEDGKFVHTRCFTRDVTASEQEQTARRILAAIVDFSDDAIISKNLDGVITTWNKSAERMFGYTSEEAVGRTVAELLVPADRQHEEPEILVRIRRGERVDHIETVRRCKDGTLLDVSLTISPVKDGSERVIGASKIARDITERKQSDAALRESQTRLTAELADSELLQDISAMLIAPGDEDALYRKIVEAVATIMRSDFATMQMLYPERGAEGELRLLASRGLTPEGEKYWEWVRFDTNSTCAQALRTGKRVVAEDVETSDFLAGTPGGAALLDAGIRSAQSTPLFSRSGNFVGMITSHWRKPHTPTDRDFRLLDILGRQAADLIERKRGERVRSQLSAIVESSGDAIYQYGTDGKILTWNAAAEALYGYTASEIVGRYADAIVPPEAMAELQEIINPGINAGRIIRNLETQRMRRDGSFFPAVLTISPVRNSSGKVVALSVIARDITQRKQMEDELRRANQDLEHFAYSASHDLQEPLRTIKIYSELLASRHTEADSESAQFLEFLRGGATRMEMLVRDLLSYTQITKLSPPEEPADANVALSEALANLGGAITESRATITADTLPRLHVQATHLRQLFQNLIGNAIKYRSPDRPPAVHVSVESEGGIWTFSVRDNGIGIEPQYKEQIFGIFSRLHNADSYEGTGIGLAICQRIVERYHGRIWVESEFGCGSTFRFTIRA